MKKERERERLERKTNKQRRGINSDCLAKYGFPNKFK
jgi:hypothetical protein